MQGDYSVRFRSNEDSWIGVCYDGDKQAFNRDGRYVYLEASTRWGARRAARRWIRQREAEDRRRARESFVVEV